MASSVFTATALTLTYDALPPATPASVAAVSSEISTDKTDVAIVITFATATKLAPRGGRSSSSSSNSGGTTSSASSAPPTPPLLSSSGPPPPPPVVATGLVAWFHAADLNGSPAGSNITSWKNRVSGGPSATHPGTGSCNSSGVTGPPVVAAAQQGALFHKSYLCSLLPMTGPKTLVAAFTAQTPASDWGCLLCGRGAPGEDTSGFDGVAIGPAHGGSPAGAQVLLDWTGSGDDTRDGYNVAQRPSVAIATFDTSSTISYVDGE
jgi:hypothetical protein